MFGEILRSHSEVRKCNSGMCGVCAKGEKGMKFDCPTYLAQRSLNTSQTRQRLSPDKRVSPGLVSQPQEMVVKERCKDEHHTSVENSA